MQERDIYERLQTEHSEDVYFYEYAQCKIDSLNEECERIRCTLDGRWDE